MRKIGNIIISVWVTIMLVLSPTLANAEVVVVSGWMEQMPPVRVGASTTYKATQMTATGVVEGVATATPTAQQVAKGIARTGGVLVVATAIELLLDGVDYVLDPANNSVRWKEKPPAIDSTGSTT